VRAPPGILTLCSCGTAPNDVVTRISRSVGCQARRIACRNEPYGATACTSDIGIGGTPSVVTFAGTGNVRS
jgi:hypothetical protein